MILPRPADALHKASLYRLLIALIDDPKVSRHIYFKGGTCASMLNFLDRFSIDLDFDLDIKTNKKILRKNLHQLFKKLDLKIKDESKNVLQFFLKYPTPDKKRNTIKLDIINTAIKSNKYSPQYLTEIDRYMNCQTIETMFGHKLVAVTDRFKKNKSIAARDIYDIHYFFLHGFEYNQEVIKQRTGIKPKDYLKKLHEFIEKNMTQTIINQDLNTLLEKKKFNLIRKNLKPEVLMLIKDEINRI